jgi:enoyl-CoA hydratase/carnithine racemase
MSDKAGRVRRTSPAPQGRPPHLVVEDDPAGFRWLRLNRPECRNALDLALARDLRDALGEDPARPVLLGSTDPRVFCAGADLNIPDAERSSVSDLVYECCELILRRPGPVIAVLTGPAVGGGAQFAAAADLRIAGPGARLRWTGPPGAELVVGAGLLPALAGRGVAMDLILTGRWLEADEALRYGVVSRVCDQPEQLAASIAAELAREPDRVMQVKRAMMVADLNERLAVELSANRDAWQRLLAKRDA